MSAVTEPTRCAGQLHYRDRHADTDRWYILYLPHGGRVAACSWECLLEYLCEPAPFEAASANRQITARKQHRLAVVR